MNEETRLINLGFVNVFLVRAGDGYILIDTGTTQQWPHLENELLQAGCLPSNLKLVIITHGDFNHTGNCAELQRKHGAKIAMHAGDVDMVRTGVPVKRKVKGIFGKLILWMGKRMMGKFNCFQPDILLEDGQLLTEYDLAAKVLYTPSNTKGSIAILTDNSQLFIGDTLSNMTRPGYSPFIG